jgi:hypothetical protein
MIADSQNKSSLSRHFVIDSQKQSVMTKFKVFTIYSFDQMISFENASLVLYLFPPSSIICTLLCGNIFFDVACWKYGFTCNNLDTLSYIQAQLFKLMQQLENTTPHFIRCIQPNNKQRPRQFEHDVVLHQLKCCGVLEVVRISRAGYPTRMTHQQFAERLLVCRASISFAGNTELVFIIIHLYFVQH